MLSRPLSRWFGRSALPLLALALWASPVQAQRAVQKPNTNAKKVNRAGPQKATRAQPAKGAQNARPGVSAGAAAAATTKTQTSPDAERLELQRFDVKSVTGKRVALELGNYSKNRRMQSEVKVFLVEGSQRTQLWSGSPTFAQTRGGFTHGLTVDLGNRRLGNNSKLEAVVQVCSQASKCKKTVSLSKGDLVLSGQPEFRTGGSTRTLAYRIKNDGPNATQRCTAQLKVDGRVVAQQTVKAMQASEHTTVNFEYPNREAEKNAEISMNCQDLVPSNNQRRLRLR